MSYYSQSNNSKSDVIDFLGSTTDKSTVTSTSKSDKKKQTETKSKKGKLENHLKSIIRILDNRLINPKDFTVSSNLLKELDEIIENIHNYQSKAKRVFKQMTDFCGKKDDENNLNRTLKHHLEGALQEIERYTDKLGEICDYIADKYLRRLCRIMKRIESYHCQGFIPMGVIIDNIDFVNQFVELLNNKLARAGEISDVSSIEPLFGGKCCTNYNDDEKADPECSDENENILKIVLQYHVNNYKMDLLSPGNYSSSIEKYISRLINENETLVRILTKNRQAMKDVNKNNNDEKIFTDDYELDENKIPDKKYEKLNLPLSPHLSERVDLEKIRKKTRKSTVYKKIRTNILNNLKKMDISSSYIKNKVPIICPCTFFKNERSVERTMQTYIEFFRFGKYLWSYIILKGIVSELTDTDFHSNGCENVRSNYFKQPSRHSSCSKKNRKKDHNDENVKYQLNSTIFQKYFGDYINNEDLYEERTSPSILSTLPPIPSGVTHSEEYALLHLEMSTMIQDMRDVMQTVEDLEKIKEQFPDADLYAMASVLNIISDFGVMIADVLERYSEIETKIETSLKLYESFEDTSKSNDERNISLGTLKHSWRTLIQNIKFINDDGNNYSINKAKTKKEEIEAEADKYINDSDAKPDAVKFKTWADQLFDSICVRAYKILVDATNANTAKIAAINPLAAAIHPRLAFGTTKPAPKTGLFGFGGIF